MSDAFDLVAAATAGAPLGRHLGFVCERMEPDVAVFRLPFAAHNVTVGEMVHGGAIAALVDAAATAAAWATPDLPQNPKGSTIGFSINYLSAALGCDLTCEARVIRRGRQVQVIDVFVHAPGGKLTARATVTYQLTGKAA